MIEVTQILDAIAQGDHTASSQLLPLVYNELRQLATHKLAHETPGQTLQPTALVHEAYLRLIGNAAEPSWDSRGHFFAAAAESMRRILLDRARNKHRLKRGGDWRRMRLEQIDLSLDEPSDDILALDEALDKLAKEDPASAELVKLRFFAGLTQEEAASAMGIGRRTADRYWAFARTWLYDALSQGEAAEPS